MSKKELYKSLENQLIELKNLQSKYRLEVKKIEKVMDKIDEESYKIKNVTHKTIHERRASHVNEIHRINKEIRDLENLKNGIINSFEKLNL